MIELTEAQRRDLDNLETLVLDPHTRRTYVLVPKEVYERMKAVFEGDGLDMHQVASLVETAMREDDAGDLTLEFYQNKYGKQR